MNEVNQVVSTSTGALVLDSGSLASLMDFAAMMASSRSTIPTHLAGNKADCAAVIMQAMQWKMNPWAVAQKTHVINGTLGYEAQLVNAVIQSSGVTQDRFSYEWYGDWSRIIGKTKVIPMPAKDGKKAYEFRVPDYSMKDEEGLGIIVRATLQGESQPRELNLLLVQASVRNSPLWASDPKQQLAYLAVKRWARLYCPDVILGVYTKDELEEIRMPEVNMGAAQQEIKTASPELLKAANAAVDDGIKSYEKFYKSTLQENRDLLKPHHDGFKNRASKVDRDRAEIEVKKKVVETPRIDATPSDNADFIAGLDGATKAVEKVIVPTDDYYPE